MQKKQVSHGSTNHVDLALKFAYPAWITSPTSGPVCGRSPASHLRAEEPQPWPVGFFMWPFHYKSWQRCLKHLSLSRILFGNQQRRVEISSIPVYCFFNMEKLFKNLCPVQHRARVWDQQRGGKKVDHAVDGSEIRQSLVKVGSFSLF